MMTTYAGGGRRDLAFPTSIGTSEDSNQRSSPLVVVGPPPFVTDSVMLTTEQERITRSPQPQHKILEWGCDDHWGWNKREKSHEVRLYGSRNQTAHFHPNWSNGTAGVRGTRLLNRGHYYWEVKVSQRVFGTSMMFGVGTKKARLHVDSFVNMLGEDCHGWGLSHKGLLWHDGQWKHYTKPFRENESTTVGVLFDGLQGTLTYFKDGASLGVAFNGLNTVPSELYPMVCSTAAKTEMTLSVMRREFHSLQDRCRMVILRSLRQPNDIKRLRLPSILKGYLHSEAQLAGDSYSVGAKREKLRKKSTLLKAGNASVIQDTLDGIRSSCLFV